MAEQFIMINDINNWDEIAAASRAVFVYIEEWNKIRKDGDKLKTWYIAKIALEAAAKVRAADRGFVQSNSSGGIYV